MRHSGLGLARDSARQLKPLTFLPTSRTQREEALRKSEQMLEEDALRFDAFLKENDEKVQEAIKRAEVEAKAKQDKVHEIKRLNAAITTIRSELNKCVLRPSKLSGGSFCAEPTGVMPR